VDSSKAGRPRKARKDKRLFAERLQAALDARRWTAADLAREMTARGGRRVSRQVTAQWTRGRSVADGENYALLVQILGVDILWPGGPSFVVRANGAVPLQSDARARRSPYYAAGWRDAIQSVLSHLRTLVGGADRSAAAGALAEEVVVWAAEQLQRHQAPQKERRDA
jgi:transcriptional regulator with XRE-family HTH domain